MTTLNIGGVPEHFNLPWQLAIEQEAFLDVNLKLNWSYYPGGTGEMVGKLNDGELDLAILLTEGFLSASAKGLHAVIVKEYITSPLIWGIFTGANSNIDSVYAPNSRRIAISRKGSGSHLMALIHAEQRGETINDYELIEIKSLSGAVSSLTKNESDIFYWEKYTTKLHVVSCELKMIGEFSAPWSSFLIVANKKSLSDKRESIIAVLEIMNKLCKDFKSNTAAFEELKLRFSMSDFDARQWLKQTIWNTDFSIKLKGLRNAAEALKRIDGKFTLDAFENLVASHISLK